MNTTPTKEQKKHKTISKEDIKSLITFSSVMAKRNEMINKIEQRNAFDALKEMRGLKR